MCLIVGAKKPLGALQKPGVLLGSSERERQESVSEAGGGEWWWGALTRARGWLGRGWEWGGAPITPALHPNTVSHGSKHFAKFTLS